MKNINLPSGTLLLDTRGDIWLILGKKNIDYYNIKTTSSDEVISWMLGVDSIIAETAKILFQPKFRTQQKTK